MVRQNQIHIISGNDEKYFVPQSYTIDYDSLAGPDSGRTADGKLHLSWILRKIVKITVKLPPHLAGDTKYSTILSLIQGQSFTVEYYDYLAHEVRSEEMYCSKTSAGYSYMGLLEDVGFELIAVQGDSVVPHVDLTEYTVTWKNWDGSVLATSTVLSGNTPVYPGSTPTRPSTAQYTYTFSGWSPIPGPISENKIYTAQFSTTINSYTITATAGAHGSVTGGGTYNYGSTVTLSAIPDTGYQLVSWNDGSTANPRTITVTGDASYSCTFEEAPTPTTYTIHMGAYISNSHEQDPDAEEPDSISDYDVRGESINFQFTSNSVSCVGIHADSAPEDFLYYALSGGGSTQVYAYDNTPEWSNANYRTIVTTTDPSLVFTGDWKWWLMDNSDWTPPVNP